MLFDFPLAFTEDLQPGGINYQVCDFTPGRVLKLTLTDFAPADSCNPGSVAERSSEKKWNQ
jgi:hypothetical protein